MVLGCMEYMLLLAKWVWMCVHSDVLRGAVGKSVVEVGVVVGWGFFSCAVSAVVLCRNCRSVCLSFPCGPVI